MPTAINSKIVHPFAGVRNVLDATPTTAQVVCPLTMGDPDTGNNVEIHFASYIHSGFILPYPGIITDIAFYAQGSNGSGVTKTVKAAVCSVKPTLTVNTAGAAIDQVLAMVANSSVLDNVSGLVTVGTGLSIAVPEMFTVGLKASFGATGIKAQAARSAGPIPGVVGTYSGGIMSVAGYLGSTTATDPPADEVAGTVFGVSIYKSTSMYIKWRKA